MAHLGIIDLKIERASDHDVANGVFQLALFPPRHPPAQRTGRQQEERVTRVLGTPRIATVWKPVEFLGESTQAPLQLDPGSRHPFWGLGRVLFIPVLDTKGVNEGLRAGWDKGHFNVIKGSAASGCNQS